jgi:7-carboxy-7-deazaguanine synthase
MFGQNPIRKQDLTNPLLAVQEIFPTIQGEGPFAGMPCIFIRMAGCNLKCHFCDTDFETNISNMMSVDQILEEIAGFSDSIQSTLVVITGGEPLRQNILPLCHELIKVGAQMIQIETAGTLWIDNLEKLIASKQLSLVCSPKTPKVHDMIALYCEDWKYIITAGETDQDDGLPTKSTQVLGMDARLFRPNESPLRLRAHRVWVQACDVPDPIKKKENMDEVVRVAIKHGYRVSFQMHKVLGVR